MLTGSVVVLLRYSLIVFFLHPTFSSSRHAEVGRRGGLFLWDRGCARLKFPLRFLILALSFMESSTHQTLNH